MRKPLKTRILSCAAGVRRTARLQGTSPGAKQTLTSTYAKGRPRGLDIQRGAKSRRSRSPSTARDIAARKPP